MAAAPVTAARKARTVVTALFHTLNESGFSTALRESDWTFSWVETVHVLALAVMAGTIAVVDFRLLGLAFQRQPVSRIIDQVTPVTWFGFLLMAASGALLFAAQPEKNAVNPAFQIKMLLLVLAGLNLVTFHRFVFKDFSGWDDRVRPPFTVRLAGGVSLGLWAAIIVLGRLIAYFPEAAG